VLEKNEKRNKKTNYAEVQYQKSEQRISAISAPAVENKYRGAFAAIDCEDDETPVKNDSFPALVTKHTTAPTSNWATIAAKPALPQMKPEVKPDLKQDLKPELKPYLKQEVKKEVSEFLKQQVKKASIAKSWADESDSEDEDDYEYYAIDAPPPSLVTTTDESDDYDW
jgi:type IV secretory pathway VirB10-like protein